MAISNFFLKKFQKLDVLYVVFFQPTNAPYIVCDEETLDDQVYAFTSDEKVKAFIGERKLRLAAAKIAKTQILPFLGSLYLYGVNMVILHEDEEIRIPLERLVKKPDIEKMRGDKVPGINPELQLSALYFLETVRGVKLDELSDEEKAALNLPEKEEEMAANLFRSKFIIAIDLSENGGKLDPKNPKFKLPFIKGKDDAMLVPCFTDLPEFRKFQMKNQGMKMHLIAVPYDALPGFSPQAKGFILNPAGFNLLLTKEMLKKLKEKYA